MIKQGKSQVMTNRFSSFHCSFPYRSMPNKSSVKTVSRQAEQEQRTCTMKKMVGEGEKDHILSTVERERDLGITIDRKLNFEQQINDMVNKANQMMGLVKRSFIYSKTCITDHLHRSTTSLY